MNIRPLFEMLQGGKMTQLDDAPADGAAAPADAPAGDVTFPDDYPNSVRGAQKKKALQGWLACAHSGFVHWRAGPGVPPWVEATRQFAAT